MQFELTKPCSNCPFRTDVTPYLRPGRYREIAQALRADGTFTCHKTIDYSDDEEGDGCGPNVQHCAGALVLLEKEGRPNQMMRWFERLGRYDRHRLDMTAPVFDTLRDFERCADVLEKR